MSHRRQPSQRGFTLLELVIVVLILAVLAPLVVSSERTTDEARVALAAEEVAAALRLARNEALRTGEVHGIEVSQVTQKVTVYKADLSTSPLSKAAILLDPLEKRPLQYVLAQRPWLAGVEIVNAQDPFFYSGLGRRKNLIFDAHGTPKWIVTGSSTTYLLTDGSVELAGGAFTHKVIVDALTGRVSIQ